MTFRHLPRLLIAAALVTPAAAAAEDDANIWLGQFATINATKKVYVRLEAQERFTNDADRLGQLLLRSLVGYRLNKNVNIGAGYAFVLTDPVGPIKLNEHRFYQELNVRLFSTEGGVTLDSRTRFEQRTFEEREDAALRLRQFIQLRVPVSGANKLVASTEPFVDLNETSVQRGGFRSGATLWVYRFRWRRVWRSCRVTSTSTYSVMARTAPTIQPPSICS